MSQSESIPEKFSGYAAMDEKSGKSLDLDPWSYKPQKWCEDYVDIKISHTSICGSCIHTLNNGWPTPTIYPAICGHEIIGKVARAGKNTTHKLGDRVGVGAQSGGCGSCEFCQSDLDQFCDKGMIGTYQGKWPDKTVAQGGYADYIRVQGKFAIPIPDELSSETAAPLMCAGITTYNPIKSGGAGPGKKVAIVGIGGLGHLGIQWSIALGAETYALSHSESKKKDVVEMGLKPENFIITSDRGDTVKKWSKKFDLILCTSFQADLPLEDLFFPLLRPQGRLTIVGLPEEKIPAIYGQSIVGKAISFGGSVIGPPALIKEMLDIALKHKVRAWTTTHPMKEVSQKVKDMKNGKARYRFVMQN
ncbi:chaperonin 10-like protein [Phakopsora pachyrhizi]|uniref:Chaperonin 10-like protein n=1 Tax=Phakopsora pachyrhizi TaxID=170000 RepID=A0AAV0BTT4_PHAPC|nr:chaperonin 10-like protein [Phakopsora pachyrhizi]CAH7689731.1 chaperonin 10-like protein [Phakopsora pachyrhizi]